MTQRGASYTDKVWLNEYPANIPHEIDVSAFQSVADIIDKSCERFRNLVAFENTVGGKFTVRYTYDDIDRLSQDFASYLQNVLGFNKGDRVAVMMPNLLQYPIAIFGILRAGMVVVNVNPLYTPTELKHQLKDSGARAIVVFENVASTLQAVIADTKIETVISTQVADMLPFLQATLVNALVKYKKKLVPQWNIDGSIPFRTAVARGRAQPYHRVALQHEDVAFLQYTGGTTGLSKGATLLHKNIVANVLQAGLWIKPFVKEGEELIFTPLPLYHIFALTANCLVFFMVGSKNVLITDPRDIGAFIAEMSKHKFTAFTGVNTLFNGLLNHDAFAKLDFSHLKLTLGGGAPVQKAVAERWRNTTGKPLSEAYGLSETSPAVTMNPLSNPEWNGTIGLPLPSTVVTLLDDDGHEVPLGQPGELCVHGPQVMRGYWNKPEENAKTFTSEGFFKTGDIGVMDERGFFKIVDRKKDMVLVSGFNVYPNEIEDVVARHNGVLEVACVGVPDDKTGEAVMIFVVKKDPNLTLEDLKEHCKKHLTGYKIPKHYEFRDSLPKSNVGKILRRELRPKK
jgi:long-chain acyl-CoA synthetase